MTTQSSHPRPRGRHLPLALTASCILGLAVAAVGAWLWLGQARRSRSAEEQAARAALQAGDLAAARAALDHWLAAEPRSGPAHAGLAELALAGGDLAEVTRELNLARDLGCPLEALERVHALVLTRLERYAEAEPILLRIKDGSREPDPAVDEALARVYLRTYRLPQAEAVLKLWAEEAPADGRPFLWLTEVDRRSGRDNLLEGHYRMALRADPGLDRARLGLAELLRDQHRPDEAAAEFAAYLSRHPDDASALTGLGTIETERGDLDAAAGHLDRALKIAPADPKALKNRALIDLRRGDAATAVEKLTRAFQADPLDDESLYHRSLAYRRLGKTAEAQADTAALDRLRKDQAEVAGLREKVARDPNDDEATCAVAAWMFAHGRDEEGLVWAGNLLDRRPTHPGVNRLLAGYYDRKGDPGRANYHRLVAGPGR
ncbi:MAG: tetratricopeptide repeat protein [Isosphaeraceae bacterium]